MMHRMARPRIAITKRRRTISTIVLMLLAWGAGGAIVNVAVACCGLPKRLCVEQWVRTSPKK